MTTYLLDVNVLVALIALACAHKGKLATFDGRLVTSAVPHGTRSLHVIA